MPTVMSVLSINLSEYSAAAWLWVCIYWWCRCLSFPIIVYNMVHLSSICHCHRRCNRHRFPTVHIYLSESLFSLSILVASPATTANWLCVWMFWHWSDIWHYRPCCICFCFLFNLNTLLYSSVFTIVSVFVSIAHLSATIVHWCRLFHRQHHIIIQQIQMHSQASFTAEYSATSDSGILWSDDD